ncbi:MAG: hypothetical protein V4609_16940 [Pseudomonadota bacterium]
MDPSSLFLIAVSFGITFIIARILGTGWRARRRERQAQAARANETRQARRARERKQRK